MKWLLDGVGAGTTVWSHGRDLASAPSSADVTVANPLPAAANLSAGTDALAGSTAPSRKNDARPCRCYVAAMARTTATIRFEATVLRPERPKGAAWAFLVLPAQASAKLPTRSMVTVDGTLDGHHFRATLEPDGQGSHWLKVGRAPATGTEAIELT